MLNPKSIHFLKSAVTGMEDEDDITVWTNNLSVLYATTKNDLQDLSREEDCSAPEACSEDDSIGND